MAVDWYRYGIAAALLVLCFSSHGAFCARILLLPIAYRSHVFEAVNLVEGLNSRGHEIHLSISSVASPIYTKLLANRNIQIQAYSSSWEEHLLENEDLIKIITLANLDNSNPGKMIETMQILLLQECVDMMADIQYVNKIKHLKYDLAVVDSFLLARCQYILPYVLDIPYVSVTSGFEAWVMRVPFFPSFVPNQFLQLSHEMSLMERIKNSAAYLAFIMLPNKGISDNSLILKYAGHKEKRTWDELLRGSELYFLNTEPVMNYPLPSMPNIIFTGGLTTKPSKPLPSHFSDIMNAAKHGVIVMSFGSIATHIPQTIVEKFAKAFSNIDNTVIWKHKSHFKFTLPENVKLFDWIPQNDLLGHNKTRIFITHSGNNGHYEALYHGVPMIAFYIAGDQPYNAHRVEYKSFGKKMHITAFKVDELVANIKELLQNDRYHQNIMKASRIFQDQPQTPTDKAAFWLEHVIKFGGSHLRSHALDMPWYEYIMLDISALCVIMLSFLFTILYLLFQFSVNMCRRSRNCKLKSE